MRKQSGTPPRPRPSATAKRRASPPSNRSRPNSLSPQRSEGLRLRLRRIVLSCSACCALAACSTTTSLTATTARAQCAPWRAITYASKHDTADTVREVREIAEAPGREVVRETLLAIGLDVADPLKLQRDFVVMREVGALAMDPEFRKDIEHTRKWRKAIEQVETKSFIAAVGMIATGVIGLVWAAIRSKVGQ